MAAEPPPDAVASGILLDVSRLVSRVGLGPLTGIDRVEAAWLRHLQGRPHHLLARVARRQLLLAPQAGTALLAWLDDPASVPEAASLARLRGGGLRARAEEALARTALGIGTGRGHLLGRRIAALPLHAWLAVGHANLVPGPWAALGGLSRAVMIHDTIPLDHPEYTRPDQVALFRRRLTTALRRADLVLTVSEATRADVLRWAGSLGVVRPPGQRDAATPIGTVLAAAAPEEVPADIPLDRPFFLTVGTIEPRKNHALLLDAWQILAARLPREAVPRLVIVGRRGWLNEAVFRRLDALPADGAVIERAGLSDGAIAALMDRAHGLLMPSRAEGFGLPLTEAAGRGLPVIAAPTPAARELLGDAALWLSPDMPAAWADAVAQSAAYNRSVRKPLAIPGWNEHFGLVTGLIDRSAGR